MIELTLGISSTQLVYALRGLEYSELLPLLLELDLVVADCGFTEDLVRGLVKSLKSDKTDVNLPFIDWEKVSSEGDL